MSAREYMIEAGAQAIAAFYGPVRGTTYDVDFSTLAMIEGSMRPAEYGRDDLVAAAVLDVVRPLILREAAEAVDAASGNDHEWPGMQAAVRLLERLADGNTTKETG